MPASTALRTAACLAVAAFCATFTVPTTLSGAAPADGRLDPQAARGVDETRVLAISIDGFNPRALRTLGRERTPNLHRLLRQGAGTRNARTQVEQTVTLPNHTSMVTGRRIDADHNGHGVTWNEEIAGTTVQEAAGEEVTSVFEAVHDAGGGTALFATKEKFALFDRSWPDDIGKVRIDVNHDGAIVRAARRDLVNRTRSFTFLHLGLPDAVGHASGWMSNAYLDAIERVDGLVGKLLRTIDDNASLSSAVVVLTADHGGVPGTTSHGDPTRLANYRVPFVIWGAGVDRGDLYEMNPTYADPGRRRVRFSGEQPVRNGDLANLSLDLLGLPALDDSLWDKDQSLTWQN